MKSDDEKTNKPGRGAPQARDPSYKPHRTWHVSSLGADLLNHGFTGFDANALMGLRGLSPMRLNQLLQEEAAHASSPCTAGDLLKPIVDQHRQELEDLGRLLSWKRRHCRYHEARTEWSVLPDDVRDGPWRKRPMTAGQRALVQITAALLNLPIPLDLNRGAAADWLESHGANLNYRGEI